MDIPSSKGRSFGVIAIGIGFIAISAWYLIFDRNWGGNFRYLAQIATWAGLLLGIVGVVGGLWNVFRGGAVVSISERGIFDRRVSEDWIPWAAIRSMTSVTIMNNSMLMLVLDPDQDARLPIKPSARRLAKVNAAIGYPGYAIAGTTLVGGFPAILAEVRRFAPHLPV